MNGTISGMTLWAIVLWPIVLAIPALRRRLILAQRLSMLIVVALLPALVMILFLDDTASTMPWLLSGIGLSLHGEARWFLAMSMVIWLMAATSTRSIRSEYDEGRRVTFVMLVIGGQLGGILSADLVGFFAFATLMGYAFYALLVQDGGEKARGAARFYIIFLVLADLLLFEAILIAAGSSSDLRYHIVHQSLSGTGMGYLYSCLVVVAFAMKAGLWPCHFWLTGSYLSATRPNRLLLTGVPVAMALLGLLRWLMVDSNNPFYGLGYMLQSLGVMALLYTLLSIFVKVRRTILPACFTTATTGLLILLLGIGICNPVEWQEYQSVIAPTLALVVVFLSMLAFIVEQLRREMTSDESWHNLDPVLQQVKNFDRWVLIKISRLECYIEELQLLLKRGNRDLEQSALKQSGDYYCSLEKKYYMVGWNFRILLLIFIGLALVWLSR